MLLIALYYISSPRGIISVQFLIFSMKSTTYDKTPYSTTVQFQNITNLTFNAVAQTKRPPKRSYVFTKAIRKRKNCRCIRRTFCECPAANLPRRTFLALYHNLNLRRIVSTIYRSLGRLLFEHIGPLLFRVFCIGFESWL